MIFGIMAHRLYDLKYLWIFTTASTLLLRYKIIKITLTSLSHHMRLITILANFYNIIAAFNSLFFNCLVLSLMNNCYSVH